MGIKKGILYTVIAIVVLILLAAPVVSFAIWPTIMAILTVIMTAVSLFFDILIAFWPVFVVCLFVAILYILGKL